ncbi:phosphoribosylformylglycinamidine cyclo-ligase [Chloroflexota bacterium]
MAAEPNKSKYAQAGVDIDLKAGVISNIGKLVKATHGPEVLSGVGPFGGLFEFKGYENPVLVSSTDSVGTKIKLAIALDKHDTVGIDIVNHCVNDIFTCGSSPIFFLDYIGIGKVVPETLESIVAGLTAACHDIGCALIGGEIAEMRDVYNDNDYDLAGFVIGVVSKDKIIDGTKISSGDALIGLPSKGLHTNGYSLARKVFGDTKENLNVRYPELGRTLGEELLEPHHCYYNEVKDLLPMIKGIAHITGGGLIENVPRILPEGLATRFQSGKWTIPPIFQLIEHQGNVTRQEMYRVFNMGIGMVLVCSPEDASNLWKSIPEAYIIGEVIEQSSNERVIIQ